MKNRYEAYVDGKKVPIRRLSKTEEVEEFREFVERATRDLFMGSLRNSKSDFYSAFKDKDSKDEKRDYNA